MRRLFITPVCFFLLLGSIPAFSEEKKDPFQYENNGFKVRVIAHSPEQMAAFYEGREFSRQAIDEVKKACFITVLMTNNSDKIIWLDVSRWRFSTNNKPVERYTRAYWKAKFNERHIPLAHQSTFGWTLLPELRDLQPNEPVGGNITMVKTKTSFTIEMHFQTGAGKKGKEIAVKFDGVQCKL